MNKTRTVSIFILSLFSFCLQSHDQIPESHIPIHESLLKIYKEAYRKVSLETYAHSRCALKQKNDVSFTVAQSQKMPVQDIQVLSYTPGAWTEMSSGNLGHDFVIVGFLKKSENESVFKKEKYIVFAKQIKDSSDCVIDRSEISEN